MTGTLSILCAAEPPKGLSARVAPGTIQATLPDDLFIVVHAEGRVQAFCGHVDLGTGIRTALAQIVAEELDVPFEHVTMILGDTDKVPNQGATIASETIQVTAVPLRQAAAQARLILLRLAAESEGVPIETLSLRDGVISGLPERNEPLPYGTVLIGRTIEARLDATVAVKDPSTYRVVGQHVARVDIPEKVIGRTVYVHDVRMDGMLHGRVIRPPYGGLDHGPFFGHSLRSVVPESVSDVPGLVDVVVINDFVGVVAEREEQAEQAARQLKLFWADGIEAPDLGDLAEALRGNPSTPREVFRRGNVEAALASAPERLERSYLWPYQMHASIGPSCAVAQWETERRLTVWSGTQNPHMLRADIALLMSMAEADITVIRHEAAGCYGRNCADDVSGDAALLSRAVGRPVRVQLSREQEHVWEPKGAAQLMEVSGALGPHGEPGAYDFSTRYPSNVSPLLGLVLTGIVPALPVAAAMGDRTSVPPYAYTDARVTVHDMPPIARASWFRGVSALPNSFAHDCFIDELALLAGEDPVAYRLRHLPDPRAVTLLTAVAERGNWTPRLSAPSPDPTARHLRGRGVAYAQYVHGTFPGVPAAWCAWIADVEVDRLTGQVAVTRVVVGQDAGMMVNPAGVRHQIEGNVIQATSRVLKEEVTFDETGVSSRDWGTYPIMAFPEIPEIDVLMLPRQDQPPLGAGESASVPSAAAIANAIFDATGVRFRTLPFTPDRIKAGLDEAFGPVLQPSASPPPVVLPGGRPQSSRRRRWAAARGTALATACAAIGGFAVTLSPWRPAIAPIDQPGPGLFSDATIARGKLLAAAGDCVVCHTAPSGMPFAGGLKLETDFGTIVTSNITPDNETGIGRWSYPAFARAMRDGVGRDGRHLYPAFPYTAFAKVNEPDMQALYAYMMSLDPVRHTPPESKLKFPYNIRPALAGWNALFQDRSAFTPDQAQSPEWNRGAYLAEGLGHCSACHSPRNILGAEKKGRLYLAGGNAEGWEAPSLSSLSHAPVPWTEAAVFDYLRTGFSAHHGPASGPMAPVVAEMQDLPDADVRAIATYVASFDARTAVDGNDTLVARLETDAAARLRQSAGSSSGARIFSGSCAACHEGSAPHMFGHRPSLAVNSNLFSSRPDNLIRVVLNGSMQPALTGTGSMPGFGSTLSNTQVAELLRYLRATFAPDLPAWSDLEATIERIRRSMVH